MSETTRVAFVVNSLRFGGAEKHTLELFNSLDSSEFHKDLIYLKREEHLLDQVDFDQGKTYCGDFDKGWDISGLLRLANRIKISKPDVLVCVNSYPLFYGYLARWMAGTHCRIIEVFHSTELPKKEDSKMRFVYRHFFNRCDGIVYVSQNQREYWEARGIDSDKGVVIHNGVNTDYFFSKYSNDERITIRQRYGFSFNDFIVGICAALRPEKQHEDLLKAIEKLKSDGLGVKCLIIGDGPRRTAIQQKISSLGLENDVSITGFQTDVRDFVDACDCIAIVSHQETFSIAALEAMALNKPMVMSDIGGSAEQVIGGVNGYLFPAADTGALAEAISKLSDSEHRDKLGKMARMIVERDFGLNDMLEKYAKLFSLGRTRT